MIPLIGLWKTRLQLWLWLSNNIDIMNKATLLSPIVKNGDANTSPKNCLIHGNQMSSLKSVITIICSSSSCHCLSSMAKSTKITSHGHVYLFSLASLHTCCRYMDKGPSEKQAQYSKISHMICACFPFSLTQDPCPIPIRSSLDHCTWCNNLFITNTLVLPGWYIARCVSTLLYPKLQCAASHQPCILWATAPCINQIPTCAKFGACKHINIILMDPLLEQGKFYIHNLLSMQ